jgi:phage/plasmid-like protein (TIGR03299 family)
MKGGLFSPGAGSDSGSSLISPSINAKLADQARGDIIEVERVRVITADAAEYGGARTVREAVTNHQLTRSDSLGLARVPGWHGLGTVIDDNLTGEDAMKRFCGWWVESRPVFCEVNGERRELPARANVRSDTGEVLGLVSDGYRIVQNVDLGRFADALVGADAALTMETCGSLLGGRKVFLLVKAPKSVRVGKSGEDETVPYLLLSNAHDGSMALSACWTMVRVVCNNTYTQALGGIDASVRAGTAFRVRHDGDIASAMVEARRVLGIAAKGLTTYEQTAQRLAGISMDATSRAEYFDAAYSAIFGAEPELLEHREAYAEKRAKVLAEWRAAMDRPEQCIDGIGGTAWALLNAVTEWMDHNRSPKVQGSRRDHLKLLGEGAAAKRTAMRLILQATR